jgi:copper(I)-binding protein
VHIDRRAAQASRGIRRFSLGVVAIGATLLTASCAAGQDAMTSVEVSVIDGANADVGDIALRVVLVQTPADGSYAVGTDAQIKAVLANNGQSDDSLTGVTAPAFSAVTLYGNGAIAGAESILDGDNATASPAPTAFPAGTGSVTALDIKAGAALSIGQTNDGPAVLLRSLTADGAGDDKGLFPGESVPVTFSFKNAGSVTVQVPVELSKTANTASIEPSGSSGSE